MYDASFSTHNTGFNSCMLCLLWLDVPARGSSCAAGRFLCVMSNKTAGTAAAGVDRGPAEALYEAASSV
jgi:hypothetical protein